MGLFKMKEFIPNTPSINRDRKYFIDEDKFIKIDTDVNRSIKESNILYKLNDSYYTPKIYDSSIVQLDIPCGKIIMQHIVGETLENIINKLSKNEKHNIYYQLSRICFDLIDREIVHGDINESNIIYNRETEKVYLIDFEMSFTGKSYIDLFGPPWGLKHICNYLKV